ncbi:thermonuclease family protein [Tardiphaga sp. 71_E8_N1_1]|uniref:thermonuclease family protein n=1 Tax=Tardiphaga sp. 71_E8_N1_1 TaxID=3240784 RepID=UPI003F8C447E
MQWRVLVLISLCCAASSALGAELIGRASVVDGDTIEIRGKRVRIWGIDAPESAQLCRDSDSLHYRCGAKAANELSAWLADRVVTCSPRDLDRYGRTVASCTVASDDIGQWLVSSGYALDFTRYSHGAYGAYQAQASKAGAGVWSGSIVEPSSFRGCMRSGRGIVPCSDGD